MAARPLIGITAFATRHIEPPHLPLIALGRRYVEAIAAAGGAPLIVPPGLDDPAMRTVFERLDGLLLSGGGDVDPACYGEAPHPSLRESSAGRDHLEVSLARWAVDEDKPLLAICRGLQVLNVALGGSLVQDIQTQIPAALPHTFDETKVAREYTAHPVEIVPGTQLHEVIGADRADANSWHHQALKRIAPGLKVVARSPDGVIEAVEMPDRRFVIGVQWHPEWLYDRQPEMMRLFEALARTAS